MRIQAVLEADRLSVWAAFCDEHLSVANPTLSFVSGFMSAGAAHGTIRSQIRSQLLSCAVPLRLSHSRDTRGGVEFAKAFCLECEEIICWFG